MDYISREAALQSICGHCSENSDECLLVLQSPCADYMDILHLPAADVREVKRGKWKRGAYTDTAPKDMEFYYCSECGHRLQTFRTNFCPNCGADMRSTDCTKTATADEEREVLNVRAWLNNGADMRGANDAS